MTPLMWSAFRQRSLDVITALIGANNENHLDLNLRNLVSVRIFLYFICIQLKQPVSTAW